MSMLRPLKNGSVDVENDGAGGATLLRAYASISFVDNEEALAFVVVDVPIGAQVVGVRLTTIDDNTSLGNLPDLTGAAYTFALVTAAEGVFGAWVNYGFDDPTRNAVAPSGGPFVIGDFLALFALVDNADGTEGGPFVLADLFDEAINPLEGIQVQVLYYMP